MMNRRHLDTLWDHVRQMHGIALRCIEALPPDQLDARPIPNMRSPKELVVHLYGGMLRPIVESVPAGRYTAADEPAACAAIGSAERLLEYCEDCWSAANEVAAKVTDGQLQSTVHTPWGDYPGAVMFELMVDEYLHHRGQLYVYLRALGATPPMMWDFAHNAPEFQPRAKAPASS